MPFLLQTDASDAAIGAVLSQVQEGHEHVISYWSRCLDKSEKNYSTVEKEALAAVAALKEYYPYIYGFPCHLITDHNPLTSLKGLKDIGGRLSCWMIFLQQFDLTITYKRGKKHSNSDTLSRAPQQDPPVAAIQPPDDLEITHSTQAQDVELLKILEALEAGSDLQDPSVAPGLRKVYIEDGLLCRTFQDSSTKLTQTQLIVPSSLRDTVLTYLHTKAGHLGIRKTLEKIKERYYWPGYQ